MAKRDTIVIRLKKTFVEQCLDPILDKERKKGFLNIGYTDASEILRRKIQNAGGIK